MLPAFVPCPLRVRRLLSSRAAQAIRSSHTSIPAEPHKRCSSSAQAFRRSVASFSAHRYAYSAFYHVYSCAFLHIGCRPISCLLVAECRYCLRMAYYFVYMCPFAINSCRFDFPATVFACGFGRVSHYLTAKLCPFASKSVFLSVKNEACSSPPSVCGAGTKYRTRIC